MWVEALTKTGSVIHAGNRDRVKNDGYYDNIPVACHAGMSRRFDTDRAFQMFGNKSPLYCNDCWRIVRREQI